jgi:ribosome-binding factor A
MNGSGAGSGIKAIAVIRTPLLALPFPMSTRTEKLSSVMQAAVQNVLIRGLNDPRIRGLVSVTRVDVTEDLTEARVFISVLPQHCAELTMHGLTDAAGYVQRQIAPDITTKRMPRLRFIADDSLKRQAELDAAIGTTADDDEEVRPADETV